jgi:hypothetical protein
MIVRGATPPAKSNDAAQWRKSWNRWRGNPVSTSSAWSRLATFDGLSGVPTIEVKT